MPPKGWRKPPTRRVSRKVDTDLLDDAASEMVRLHAENARLQARLDLLDKYAKALGFRLPEA